eukprot:gnl/TRDRNA2_/TRDRNA2_87528_c0_seq1.p1 gnl/TRDRNA2_/TRDRNA2_87528_c0~~gnl/TRDRNA2_/TRDRNA2_87528_c0_seq1.p1  ORF type:complete len:224 (-),score=51.74 gnl/TRDRNA2_/TRDRNA2_87528_c0_seq1:311-949(-)
MSEDVGSDVPVKVHDPEVELLSHFGTVAVTPCGVPYVVTESGRFISAGLTLPELSAKQACDVLHALEKAHGHSSFKTHAKDILRKHANDEGEAALSHVLDPEATLMLEKQAGILRDLEPGLLAAEAKLLQSLKLGPDRHARWAVQTTLKKAASESAEVAAQLHRCTAEGPLVLLMRQVREQERREKDLKKAGPPSDEDVMAYLLEMSFDEPP